VPGSSHSSTRKPRIEKVRGYYQLPSGTVDFTGREEQFYRSIADFEIFEAMLR
jgi:hypothetical protein